MGKSFSLLVKSLLVLFASSSVYGQDQIAFQAPSHINEKAQHPSRPLAQSFTLTHVIHAGGAKNSNQLVAKSFDDARFDDYVHYFDPRRDGPEAGGEVHGNGVPAWPTYDMEHGQIRSTRVYKAPGSVHVDTYRERSIRALAAGNPLRTASFQWDEDDVVLPDVHQRNVLSAFARMASNAYTTPNASDWYDLPPVTSGKGDRKKHIFNDTLDFGWEEDGVRGHVFADESNSTVVLAIKGTSAGWWTGGGGKSGRNDKFNDNLLFSCCCARVDYSFPTVCDCFSGNSTCSLDCLQKALSAKSVYYNALTSLYTNVTAMYPDSQIWLTGHSLGGALAALLGVTYGHPTIAFESPGDKLAAERLHLPRPPTLNYTSMPVWHYGVSSDPIFTGSCTGWNSLCWAGGFALETACHLGKTCVYDTMKRLNWTTSIQTHSISVVIDKVIDVWPDDETPECTTQERCGDCSRWDYV